jgi:hypothetical protein
MGSIRQLQNDFGIKKAHIACASILLTIDLNPSHVPHQNVSQFTSNSLTDGFNPSHVNQRNSLF